MRDPEILERLLRQIIRMFMRGSLCYYDHMNTVIGGDVRPEARKLRELRSAA